ncbi:hypothetical protein ACOSP7_020967 [Xanthoceras sorbifolium]
MVEFAPICISFVICSLVSLILFSLSLGCTFWLSWFRHNSQILLLLSLWYLVLPLIGSQPVDWMIVLAKLQSMALGRYISFVLVKIGCPGILAIRFLALISTEGMPSLWSRNVLPSREFSGGETSHIREVNEYGAFDCPARNFDLSSEDNQGKEPLSEPLDLELRLGPPGGTANPDFLLSGKEAIQISDQALQAWQTFLRKKETSTEAEEVNFHNETLCSGLFSALREEVKIVLQLYNEMTPSQVSPSNSKLKKVILLLTKDKGSSYKKYINIIQDLHQKGAENDSFKEILKILESI